MDITLLDSAIAMRGAMKAAEAMLGRIDAGEPLAVHIGKGPGMGEIVLAADASASLRASIRRDLVADVAALRAELHRMGLTLPGDAP